MALFGSKKNKGDSDAPAEKKVKAPKAEKAPKAAKAEKSDAVHGREVSHVLRQPRITEKATFISEGSNVYVFEVAPKATKHDVIIAMGDFYKVKPVKVNMVTIPSKKVFIRGKRGVKSGGKKAYVYLKKGESIEVL